MGLNLHSVVSSVIPAVNPMTAVLVRAAVGVVTDAAGKQTPAYATPGSLSGSIAAGVLTASTIASGVLQAGQQLAGAGIPDNVRIASQLTGGAGKAGTYQLTQAIDGIALETITTSLPLLAQIQPMTWRDLQMLDGVSMNGIRKSIYLNGNLDGIIRVQLKGGDLVTFGGQTWLVGQQLEGFNPTAGWTKAAITLQDGS